MPTPRPEDEAKRLEALAGYGILDTPEEESFDRITRLAARLFTVPIALISLVDRERVWFKSRLGVDIRETSRENSFSAWTVLSSEVLAVTDAACDPRFRDSAMVLDETHFRFYAGAPLLASNGARIGALSIIDYKPRSCFSEEEARNLASLAALIVDQLELRATTLRLRASEADYRALFENAPTGIYRTSPAGEIAMANPAILDMVGYPSLEALKSRNLDADHMVETRSEWQRRLEEAGKIVGHESVWYKCDGSPLQIRETTRVVRRGDGTVAYYEGWAEDISLRKAAEAEREEARLLNQKLLAAVPDLIYIFNVAEGRTVYASPSFAEVIGHEREKVLRMESAILELVHPDDLPYLQLHRLCCARAKDGEVCALEFRMRDKDGKFRVLSTREMVFSRDEKGAARELLGVMANVSEHRSIEERLRSEEERWQLVMAANNDGLWDWDARKDTVFHSPRWREMLGFSAADVYDPDDWENLLHPEEAARVKECLAAYLRRESKVYQQEYRLRTKDGSYRWVLARGLAQWGQDGEPTRMVGSHSDITERKKTELALQQQAEELSQARNKAESAARAKSSFLATMSHEIRTPLNGILGMTGILAETALTFDQRDYLQTIASSGNALLGIINDILDFSKIESGYMELEDADFDLRALMEDSLDLVAEAADRKGLELGAPSDPAVPGRVRGDAGRLRQILLNLLSNAVKFTERGEVVLNVAVVKRTHTGTMLKFSVSDTGIGMPAEVLTRIFDPFTQADASTTRRFGGSGLGLAISKQIVGLMGGDIGVASDEGAGSTFWFTVQFQRADTPAKMDHPSDCLRGARILVAEDNATNRRIAERSLEAFGATVLCAHDGIQALSMLLAAVKGNKAFDLALIDFQMPLMDGVMLTRAIRAQQDFQNLPIVLLTSVTQREHVHEAKQLNIQEYLVKPLRHGQLIDTVRRLLRPETAQRRELEAADPAAVNELLKRHRGRVLLAEDNPVNQKVGTLMLTRLGYQVDVVANGRQAVEALRNVPYRAILLDCQMPEMDGLEAARAIRAGEEGERRVPIIALTANALSGERERCLEAGMDDYLSKPVSQKLLAEKLEAWLSL
jgi:PAS domain S-box-containing protein